jgi:hypothetical protein
MYPMLAGIGPILGDGVAGYFIEPTGDSTFFGYGWRHRKLGRRDRRGLQRPAKYAELRAASCGASTAHTAYALGDGSVLILTTGVMADRNRVQYGGSIPPDYGPEGTVVPAISSRATL